MRIVEARLPRIQGNAEEVGVAAAQGCAARESIAQAIDSSVAGAELN
jgi:hypothetical protein